MAGQAPGKEGMQMKGKKNKNKLNNAGQLKASIITSDNGSLLNGEKLSLIFDINIP